MSYRSFIIVQGSLSNNLYWIYALLSRNQPCRDYALWEALFGQNWWEGAQKHFRGPGDPPFPLTFSVRFFGTDRP